MQQIFKTPIKVNKAKIIEIPSGAHQFFQNVIAKRTDEEQNLIQQKTKIGKERTENISSTFSQATVQSPSSTTDKWKELYKKQSGAPVNSLTPSEQLIKRFEGLIHEEKILVLIRNTITEITNSGAIDKLMQYNDKTLAAPNNIKAIIEERLDDIKEIADELVATSTTNVNTIRLTL
jgi:hypothetical protein